ncbi:MAG TPA: penicillin-binding transpeptidase domain-containing protein [Anaerolineales bacterium]|jgi:penicillin-binding protein 2
MRSSSVTAGAHIPTWRLAVVYVIVGVGLAVLLARLLALQVFGTVTWDEQAVENYTRAISLPAARGIIYDRNGFILARNIAAYNVVITPAELPDDDADIQRIYREVSQFTGVAVGGPVTDESLGLAKLFAACVPGPSIADLVALGDSLAPYSPVKVKCDVSEEVARMVRERSVDLPGVAIDVEPIRDYPTGSLTADVIGFLGPIPAADEASWIARGFVPNRDKIGYAGAETSLQDVLAGQNGTRVIQIDVAGKELRNLEPPVASVPGYNVTLTIDTRLQAAAEASLIEEMNYWNTYFGRIRISSGVVIAMNPKTGEILAMVSFPTYENNRMARLIPAHYFEQLSQDPRHPLLNNAISAEFPPGSVFKLSTATGAFNEGVVTLDKTIFAPGKLELCEKFSPNDPCTPQNTRPFVDWIYDQRPEGFGQIDFLHCIAYSSNVCFYKLGGGFGDEIKEGLGIFRLGEYARAIGYAQPSGIELFGEADGLIPSPQWKRINTGENWSTGDTYIASVGQGYVLATPLQVLMSGATIANYGKLMQPTIVREVTDGQGKVREVWFNPADFTIWNVQQVTDADGTIRKVWINPADSTTASQPPEGSYQISPFVPNMKWDVTQAALINAYSCDQGFCEATGEMKTVAPATIEAIRTGTRMAVTEPSGTLRRVFEDFPIAVAGKTGTAEYCDDVARAANRCQFGSWPTHSWTLAYAPYDDPEIIVMAFCYNGGEGASVAAPIVSRVIRAYFELKAIDVAQGGPGG